MLHYEGCQLSCYCIISIRQCNNILSFFFNDTATTEIYTLSLHDALPIYIFRKNTSQRIPASPKYLNFSHANHNSVEGKSRDRKSTRLNSSHANISYAVFCLKKKNKVLPYQVCRLLLQISSIVVKYHRPAI